MGRRSNVNSVDCILPKASVCCSWVGIGAGFWQPASYSV